MLPTTPSAHSETLRLLAKEGMQYGATKGHETPRTTKFSTWKQIGRLLQYLSGYAKHIKLVYTIALTNILIVIVCMILCKLFGKAPWLQVWPRLNPLNDWYYQLANLSLVVSYALTDLLHLRICLLFACLFFTLFGCYGFEYISPDGVIWNILMTLINGYQIVEILWRRRYIEFAPEFEKMYDDVFEPIGLSRHDFKLLCKVGYVRRQMSHALMHDIGDKVTSLCILVSGTVNLVDEHGKVISRFVGGDILEAMPWVQSDLDPEHERYFFQYIAKEPVVFIKFSREMLRKLVREKAQLEQPLRTVLGLAAAKTTGSVLGARMRRDTLPCVPFSLPRTFGAPSSVP